MIESSEMQDLIALRSETPELVAVQDVSHDAAELYRFPDGTEVIVTNAGILTEDVEGFAQVRALILQESPTSRFTIRTDACQVQIDAVDADAAAVEFAIEEEMRDVRSVNDLIAHIERVGGWLTVEDEAGNVLVQVK